MEQNKPVVYISGPMTGYPNWNHDAFNKKAAELRAQGYTVLNPAENDGGSIDKSRAFYLRQDILHVLNSEVVVLLPGWRRSRGARLEVAIAEELELPIYEGEIHE